MEVTVFGQNDGRLEKEAIENKSLIEAIKNYGKKSRNTALDVYVYMATSFSESPDPAKLKDLLILLSRSLAKEGLLLLSQYCCNEKGISQVRQRRLLLLSRDRWRAAHFDFVSCDLDSRGTISPVSLMTSLIIVPFPEWCDKMEEYYSFQSFTKINFKTSIRDNAQIERIPEVIVPNVRINEYSFTTDVKVEVELQAAEQFVLPKLSYVVVRMCGDPAHIAARQPLSGLNRVKEVKSGQFKDELAVSRISFTTTLYLDESETPSFPESVSVSIRTQRVESDSEKIIWEKDIKTINFGRHNSAKKESLSANNVFQNGFPESIVNSDDFCVNIYGTEECTKKLEMLFAEYGTLKEGKYSFTAISQSCKIHFCIKKSLDNFENCLSIFVATQADEGLKNSFLEKAKEKGVIPQLVVFKKSGINQGFHKDDVLLFSKTFSFLIELINKEKTLYGEIKAISKSKKKTKESSKTNASREIPKGEKKEKLKLKKKKASE